MNMAAKPQYEKPVKRSSISARRKLTSANSHSALLNGLKVLSPRAREAPAKKEITKVVNITNINIQSNAK